jgi:hypothetical protein
LVLAGNHFWCYLRTYSTTKLWHCVSFWFWQVIVFGVTYVLRLQSRCAVVSVFWLWQETVLQQRRNRYLEVPAKRYKTKNTNQNTNHQEFLPDSSQTEFSPNCQNWVPTKRYSTKNTNQNTNHQVPVLVTYQYQPNSQYWWKFLPLPPHLSTIHIYLYIAIAYARTSCNDIIMYIRLCVMSTHNCRKKMLKLRYKKTSESCLQNTGANCRYRTETNCTHTQ